MNSMACTAELVERVQPQRYSWTIMALTHGATTEEVLPARRLQARAVLAGWGAAGFRGGTQPGDATVSVTAFWRGQ
jgi:hypothetical protein